MGSKKEELGTGSTCSGGGWGGGGDSIAGGGEAVTGGGEDAMGGGDETRGEGWQPWGFVGEGSGRPLGTGAVGRQPEGVHMGLSAAEVQLLTRLRHLLQPLASMRCGTRLATSTYCLGAICACRQPCT